MRPLSLLLPLSLALAACGDAGSSTGADTTTTDTSATDLTDDATASDTATGDTSSGDDTSSGGDTLVADTAADDTAQPDTNDTDTTAPAKAFDGWPGVKRIPSGDRGSHLRAVTFTADGELVVAGAQRRNADFNQIAVEMVAYAYAGPGDATYSAYYPVDQDFAIAETAITAADGTVILGGRAKSVSDSNEQLAVLFTFDDDGADPFFDYSFEEDSEAGGGFEYSSIRQVVELPGGDLIFGGVAKRAVIGPEQADSFAYLKQVTRAGASVDDAVVGYGPAGGVSATVGGLATGPAGFIYLCTSGSGVLGDGTSLGGRDVGLFKVGLGDSDELTAKMVGTSGDDYCDGVVYDGTTVFVAGSTTGDLAGTGDGRDIFIASYSGSDLTPGWSVQVSEENTGYATRVILGEDGHLYLIGVANRLNDAQAKAWVASYTTDGTERWSETYGSYGTFVNPRDAAMFEDDLFVVADAWNNNDDDGELGDVAIPKSGDPHGFILRIDAATGALY